MRDKRRIDRIMQKLEMIFLYHYDQSFMKTLTEIFPDFGFYEEDDTTEATIDKYIEAHDIKPEDVDYYDGCVQYDILDCIHDIWQRYPDFRFMQLILNLVPSLECDTDPESYVGDDEILEHFENMSAYYMP